MIAKKYITLFALIFFLQISKAQLLSNGNFALGTLMWGCGAEASAETIYGGSSTNMVAEVDAVAGLCQTYVGFAIGNAYVVTFNSSRRTGGCPSPAITNVNVDVSGGVLATTVTRTNTAFGWSTNSYLFVATSLIHTLSFSAGFGMGSSTCGMIIDNISVSFSPLPIELLNFDGTYKNGVVEFDWSTASEKDNEFFEIERSANGIDFETFLNIPSKSIKGTSLSKLNYKSKDGAPMDGTNYYRLKQTDFNKTFSYSKIIAVSATDEIMATTLFPNPSNGDFTITTGALGNVNVNITNHLGIIVHSQLELLDKGISEIRVKVSNKIAPGIYQCHVRSENHSQISTLVIQ